MSIETNNLQEPIVDKRFNVLSYEQYQRDLKTKKFNKMCMTEVVNADMMIATFGEENYFQSSADILAMGNSAYKMMGIDHLIHVYIHNYKSFMAVANDDMSDEDFLNLMMANHEQYELINSQSTGNGGVSRFVIVFGDDMINRATSAYYLNRDLQNNFIVATDEKERLAAETEHNLELFELLNHAITNDKVVPFYQGIYNNEQNKITKYEALIRISDQNGVIQPPGKFLDAAKQLKLYLTLSRTMIDKALTDFEGKQSELGLNLSLLDIQSSDFRDWFFKRIQKHPDPSKVIVEFVETENYNNDHELSDFLMRAKQLGCKVAVDDFGSGFATYSSIIACKPDIIKIDGEIIKHLANNNESKIILDSICYMARLIGSKIIAEFVENAEIQKIISENSIAFSQGYHFAKPEPITNLNID